MNPRSPERVPSKRIWRVPKEEGPVAFFATALCKRLILHGWPASWREADIPGVDGFVITKKKEFGPPGADFWAAVEIAARVVARQYGVEIVQTGGFIELAWAYRVTERGEMKRIK